MCLYFFIFKNLYTLFVHQYPLSEREQTWYTEVHHCYSQFRLSQTCCFSKLSRTIIWLFHYTETLLRHTNNEYFKKQYRTWLLENTRVGGWLRDGLRARRARVHFVWTKSSRKFIFCEKLFLSTNFLTRCKQQQNTRCQNSMTAQTSHGTEVHGST